MTKLAHWHGDEGQSYHAHPAAGKHRPMLYEGESRKSPFCFWQTRLFQPLPEPPSGPSS